MGRDRVRGQGRTTRWKLVEGFLWNAGAWAVMSFGLGLPRSAMWWWGLAVAMHGLGVGAKLLGLDEGRTPDLAGEVERLRLDLRAEAELESDLARARLGGRLQQRT